MSGNSISRGSKKTITSYTTQNPPVICLDKDENHELSEMGNKSTSQDSTQDMSSQANGGSPIMFPEPANNDEIINDVENKEVCVEVHMVDDETQQQVDGDVSSELNNGHNSSNKVLKVIKEKGRLSLGRKRPASCGNNDDGTEQNNAKRRLVKKEDKEGLTIENENMQSVTSTNSSSTAPPILLKRSFNCHHKVFCRTLQEADQMDLYFAPRGVNSCRYAKVIVRKFERYRQRLYAAQLRQRLYHPLGNPVEPATTEPPPTVPPPRAGLRTRRPSVVIKNKVKEVKSRTDKNEAVKSKKDLSENSDKTDKSKSPSNNRVDERTDLKETSSESPGPPLSVPPNLNDVEPSGADDDVVIKTGHISEIEETAWRRQRSADQPAVDPSLKSSPVKPTLKRKVRHAVLEESSSDDESPKFNFQTPEQKPTTYTDETLLTVSDYIPLISDNITTSQEIPSEENPKNESVTVSSSIKTLSVDTKQYYKCPMCFNMFAEDKIEAHAARCEGETAEFSTTSTTRELDGHSIMVPYTRRGNDVNDRDKNDGEMSPVIKVRTPTKVRELKMLKLNVTVRNLADEFPTSPKPGERFEMFGVNIIQSPKYFSRSGDELRKKRNTPPKCTKTRGACNTVRSDEDEKTPKVERQTGAAKKVATRPHNIRKLHRTSELEFEKTDVQHERTGIKNNIQHERNGTENNAQCEESEVERVVGSRETEAQSTSRRKSHKHTGKGTRPPVDISLLNEDFISLYYEQEETENKSDVLPSEAEKTSLSSSDGEDIPKNPDVVASKATSKNDNLSALDFMSNAYQGTKRKTFKVGKAAKRSRKHVAPEDDESLEKCALCQKFIPTEIFPKHVAEEIEQMKLEKSNGSQPTPFSSHTPCNTALTTRTNKRPRTPSRGLPDLAQATTNDHNLPDSPLKTYTPINQSCDIDYLHQFSYNDRQSHSKKDTKYGTKYGKFHKRTRRKKK